MNSYRTIAEGVCKVFEEVVKKNLNIEYSGPGVRWDNMNVGDVQSKMYIIKGEEKKFLNITVMRVSSGMYEVKDYIV